MIEKIEDLQMKIYILVADCGDGSYSLNYVNDPEVIKKLEELDREDKLDPEFTPGCDGDGFHYETITVPDFCTEETLGITFSTLPDIYQEDE